MSGNRPPVRRAMSDAVKRPRGRLTGHGSMTRKLTAAGATLLAGPVFTPWRHRNVRLETPDRHRVTLFSPTRRATPSIPHDPDPADGR